MPRSLDEAARVLQVAEAGGVCVDLRWHPRAGKLVLERVWSVGDNQSELSGLREAVRQACPEANVWARSATLEQLRIARRILQIPRFQEYKWPPKVWAAIVLGHSKAGDVTHIVKALGGQVNRRLSSHAVWFYGQGIIHSESRLIEVNGETPIASAELKGRLRLEPQVGSGLTVVENRDVAFACNGFVMALDGQPTPVQKHVIREASKTLPVKVWPDMDAAGVDIIRQLRAICPALEVLGLARWPTEWQATQTKAGARQKAILARRGDALDVVLDWVRDHGWYEQERIAAEADIAGLNVDGLARQHRTF